MKKVFLTAFVAAAFALGMSACCNNKPAEEAADTTNTECCEHQHECCHHECECTCDSTCAANKCEGCVKCGTEECCKVKAGEKCCKAEGEKCCKHECEGNHEGCQHQCEGEKKECCKK